MVLTQQEFSEPSLESLVATHLTELSSETAQAAVIGFLVTEVYNKVSGDYVHADKYANSSRSDFRAGLATFAVAVFAVEPSQFGRVRQVAV